MEKFYFIKAFTELEENNVVISQIATDRNIQIKKYMCEENAWNQPSIWYLARL